MRRGLEIHYLLCRFFCSIFKSVFCGIYLLGLCLSANQYTLCSLLIKGQIPKRQAVQRLRIYIHIEQISL